MALIEANADVICGRAVLDIASHDGRWSFAALMAGARSVYGIEARPDLVESAEANFRHYGVASNRYTFHVGDVHTVLKELPTGAFDTVLCFGFFYHTVHHVALLSEMARIAPTTLLMDTGVWSFPGSSIVLREELGADPRHAVAESWRPGGLALVGVPTLGALALMLRRAGFEPTYSDWLGFGIQDWTGIEEYAQGRRVTVRARNLYASTAPLCQPSTQGRWAPSARGLLKACARSAVRTVRPNERVRLARFLMRSLGN